MEQPAAHLAAIPKAAAIRRSAGLRIALVVLGIKLAVLAYGGLAVMVLDGVPVSAAKWLDIWNRWDAPHYLDIARDGYVREGEQSRWIVFFPLYPLLVRAFSVLIANPTAAAMMVSAVALVAAAIVLHRLGATEISEASGRNAVVFLLVFPTSYFLHIGYTESTFLALAAGAILCARRRAWAGAGLLGGLATLTRLNGLVLLPALLIEAFLQHEEEHRPHPRRLLWLLAIPAAFGIYLAINATVFGDPFAFLRVQRMFWYKSLSPPWVGLQDALRTALGDAGIDAVMVGWSEFGFALLALAATVWSAARLRATYAVWMGGNWLLLTSTTFLLSAPRYVLVLLPLFLLLGGAAEKRPLAGRILMVISTLMLAFYAARFARGHWAF